MQNQNGISGNIVLLEKYITFNSKESSNYIISFIGNFSSCLFANYGIVTVGQNISATFAVADGLDLIALMYNQTE